MKVVVCGGRDFRGPGQVWRALDRLHAEHRFTDLMQGGCPTGVDRFAKEWRATKPEIRGWQCDADWVNDGPSAGPRRNARMIEWKPDLVIAFPGGRGTADMVRQAWAAGIVVADGVAGVSAMIGDGAGSAIVTEVQERNAMTADDCLKLHTVAAQLRGFAGRAYGNPPSVRMDAAMLREYAALLDEIADRKERDGR